MVYFLLPHFIGYAVPNKDDTGLVGKLGLEAAYNDVLSGKMGKSFIKKITTKMPYQGQSLPKKKKQ